MQLAATTTLGAQRDAELKELRPQCCFPIDDVGAP